MSPWFKPWTFNVKRPSVHDLTKLLRFRNALTPMPLIRIDASRIASESIANHYQLVNWLEQKKILVKSAFLSLTNQASPSDGGWKTLNTLIATTSPQGIHESWCNHCKTISRHQHHFCSCLWGNLPLKRSSKWSRSSLASSTLIRFSWSGSLVGAYPLKGSYTASQVNSNIGIILRHVK